MSDGSLQRITQTRVRPNPTVVKMYTRADGSVQTMILERGIRYCAQTTKTQECMAILVSGISYRYQNPLVRQRQNDMNGTLEVPEPILNDN